MWLADNDTIIIMVILTSEVNIKIFLQESNYIERDLN